MRLHIITNSWYTGTFNVDFLPFGAEREGDGGVKTGIASLLDKRQPGGSRPGEVDDGEDAQCVSSNPHKAFWGMDRVNSLCV